MSQIEYLYYKMLNECTFSFNKLAPAIQIRWHISSSVVTFLATPFPMLHFVILHILTITKEIFSN